MVVSGDRQLDNKLKLLQSVVMAIDLKEHIYFMNGSKDHAVKRFELHPS